MEHQLESQTPQLLIRLGILRLTIKFQIIFFQDSTERPIQRPKDPQRQKAYYSGKKKQHTHKNNLVIDAACKVVLLTPTCEGRIHDKRIADATRYCLPNGSTLFQDSGFQGFSLQGITSFIQPKRNPKDETSRLKKKRGIVLFHPSVSESNM